MAAPDRIVHVVEDDAPVREALQRLLRAANFVVIPYETAFAVLEATPALSKGCMLLDVRLPGMDGLELQARLNRLGIALPLILLTGQGDVEMAVRALKAGAVDFVEKPFDPQHLLATIEAALAGAAPTTRQHEREHAARRIAGLSPRERQVLEALVGGQVNRVIAHDLGISERTVEVHRARMLQHLGVRKLADAIRVVVIAGLE